MEILTAQYCTYRIQWQRRHETGNVLVHSWRKDHPKFDCAAADTDIERNEHWPMKIYQRGRITQVRITRTSFCCSGATPEARSHRLSMRTRENGQLSVSFPADNMLWDIPGVGKLGVDSSCQGATSRRRFGETQHGWRLHVHNFVSYRIQHQLGDRVKLEFAQDIAAMGFCRCYCHRQDLGDLFGSLALTH